jgi:hypothetical protein
MVLNIEQDIRPLSLPLVVIAAVQHLSSGVALWGGGGREGGVVGGTGGGSPRVRLVEVINVSCLLQYTLQKQNISFAQ